MFTRTDSQRSLFDVKNVIPDALPEDEWRGVEFQYPRRLDWLGATRTPRGGASIDHTT